MTLPFYPAILTQMMVNPNLCKIIVKEGYRFH
jgi:hypothetical protein